MGDMVLLKINYMYKVIFLQTIVAFSWMVYVPFAEAAAQKKTEPTVTEEDRARVLARVTSFNQNPEIKKQEIHKGEVFNNLPKSLSDIAAKDSLIRRIHVPIYQHNPMAGNLKAPITIIEFSNIGCTSCSNITPIIKELMDKYPNHIRHIHKHASDNPFATDNLAAFYSKIANRHGLFWKFREELSQVKVQDDETLLLALKNAGLAIRNSQQMVRLNARDVYREIDADASLNKSIKLGKLPIMLVNGIQIGASIPFDALNDLILYELHRKKINIASLEEPAHDK